MKSKVLSMMGLCRRAGQMVIGADLVTKKLPSKKIRLVIYAENSSPNTEKRILDKCKFYNVPVLKAELSSEEIGRAVGKEGLVCVLGIEDQGFSSELTNLLFKSKEAM